MAQELNENPDFPERFAFEAQVPIGKHLITLGGLSLSKSLYAVENFRYASMLAEAFLLGVRHVPSRRSHSKEADDGIRHVLWANGHPYFVNIGKIVVADVRFSEGSIKIQTILKLAVILQGINLSYDAISKYPSFKQGISELGRDIEWASGVLFEVHEQWGDKLDVRLPKREREKLAIEIDFFKEDDEVIENALRRIAIENSR